MRIFDCFIMRDEIDILNIRLQELSDHVDIFVIEPTTKQVVLYEIRG